MQGAITSIKESELSWLERINLDTRQINCISNFPGHKTIIGVLASEEAVATPEAHKMQESINEELKKLAQTVNANFLLVDNEIGEGEKAWVDNRH